MCWQFKLSLEIKETSTKQVFWTQEVWYVSSGMYQVVWTKWYRLKDGSWSQTRHSRIVQETFMIVAARNI